jgi:glycosyltransferase involved in cell wall biosynthesis
MRSIFITDPLVTRFGAVRPALLLSIELRRHGFDTMLVSPRVDEDVKGMIERYGIQVVDLGVNFHIMPQLPTFEAWARALLKRKDSLLVEDGVVINTSSCIIVDSHVYYGQGPMTKALDDMVPEIPRRYRYAYKLSGWALRTLERRLVKRFRRMSKFFIANSSFCRSMYEAWGVKIDEVIPPPLDRRLFRPTTSRPRQDYVLTYFGVYGKESKYSVIKKVADSNVKIKAFGSKPGSIPKPLLKHPNIEFLGRVSDEELVDLYSNALYTLFTFTHEPFGYIPVESMTCGTPVLTYNKQGPSESVVKGVTGWLANSDEELVELAVKIWREGYPSWMKAKCRERALEFDVKIIADKWLKIIKQL